MPKAGRVIKSDAFLNSLFELGLGRASLLFPFDDDKDCFHTAIEDGRVTGTTLQLSRAIIEHFTEVGHTTCILRSFVSSVYDTEDTCAGLVALASITRTILDAVEEFCIAQRQHIASLLQLQQLFEQPEALLGLIRAIYDHVQAEGLSSVDDESVAWSAFEALQEYEASGLDVSLLQTLFRRVSQPWLEELERRIGLRHDTNHKFEAIRSDDQNWSARSTGKNASRLMSSADIDTLAETHDCIAYMQQHHPDHPLSTPEKLNGAKCGFEWTVTWSDLDHVTAKAREYQDGVQSAIATLERSGDSLDAPDTSRSWPGGRLETLHVDPWAVDFDLDFNLRASDVDVLDAKASDDLHGLVDAYLSSADITKETTNALPTALIVESSLQPMLKAQHTLLTTATLEATLRVHQLSHHLETLHTFHLFGSGIFATSISHILFAPDTELAERRKGVARSGRAGAMGLALGSERRREWPPTSSELSLALMGVLEDCGSDSAHSAAAPRQTFSLPSSTSDQKRERSQHKPGASDSSLSFALRTELDPKTIERVVDASTIYALDFLKLSYTPPPALRLILTDDILGKYDRIFQLLLRLLRIQFVIGQLFADLSVGNTVKDGTTQQEDSNQHLLRSKFRHRATHFITTLLTYFQYTAIETPWRELMQYIASAETNCSSGKYTLATLRATHEKTLNRILSGLFLRRRQTKLADLLENLSSDILNFTQVVRRSQTAHNTGIETGESVSTIHQRFTTHHSQFVSALEEAAQRAEMGKGMRGAELKSSDADSKEVIEGFTGLALLLR